jgi:carbonic anhydrase/acetyltransferase-like protein (isoleucine patch superfamily)
MIYFGRTHNMPILLYKMPTIIDPYSLKHNNFFRREKYFSYFVNYYNCDEDYFDLRNFIRENIYTNINIKNHKHYHICKNIYKNAKLFSPKIKNKVSIGKNNIIGKNCAFGCDVIIGDNNIIGDYTIIGDDCVIGNNNIIGDFNLLFDKANIQNNNIIKNKNIFWRNSKISNFCCIGDENMIGGQRILNDNVIINSNNWIHHSDNSYQIPINYILSNNMYIEQYEKPNNIYEINDNYNYNETLKQWKLKYKIEFREQSEQEDNKINIKPNEIYIDL